jgi:2-C-methyl-D-erythritol 2,4-cyclodiphosphate synthase
MTTGLRVGHGFDVHEFMAGDHVVLAGVRIPHTQGVKAHSDGDVVIHALCDALLGAAALGDIGMHFPDSDPVWKGADSRRFLRHVKHLLAQKHYHIVNVDITVLAEAPRLGSHRETMRTNLASDLALSTDCVNVKATTTEKLGFIGRREGLAAHAVALIELA